MLAFAPDRRALAVVRASSGTARDLVIVPADTDLPPSHSVTPDTVSVTP